MPENPAFKKIAILGAGPAGVMAGIFAMQNPCNEVVLFDKSEPLKTLLPTGGGRCNLAYDEHDFKALAKFYPRGEKFLYSVLSRFSTHDTIEFFKSLGVKTYVQPDSRIFPISDSSHEVRNALLRKVNRENIRREKVCAVTKSEGAQSDFVVRTDKNEYHFDAVILAGGSKGAMHEIAKNLGHNIIDLKPALTSLKTVERDFFGLSGMSLQNIEAKVCAQGKKEKTLRGDLLFTHFGLSGPLAYKISSYYAYEDFSVKKPLKIVFNLIGKSFEEFDSFLKEEFNVQAKKDILNMIDAFVPRNFAQALLEKEKIDPKTKAGQLKKEDRVKIAKNLTNLVLHACGVSVGEEIVSAGGVDLKEINPKTMESKIVSGLYFCGEIMDIDGLTGGFNLQNCWATGFIAGDAV